MNERIRKLAQESGMYVDLNGNAWPKSMSAEECEVAYKKFAELIVKECVQICKTVNSVKVVNAPDTYQEGREMGSFMCMEEIKEHFGVEE